MLVGVLGKGIVIELRRFWLIDFEERILIIEIRMTSQQQDLYIFYIKPFYFSQRKHIARILLEESFVIFISFFWIVRQLKVKMYLKCGP